MYMELSYVLAVDHTFIQGSWMTMTYFFWVKP